MSKFEFSEQHQHWGFDVMIDIGPGKGGLVAEVTTEEEDIEDPEVYALCVADVAKALQRARDSVHRIGVERAYNRLGETLFGAHWEPLS